MCAKNHTGNYLWWFSRYLGKCREAPFLAQLVDIATLSFLDVLSFVMLFVYIAAI